MEKSLLRLSSLFRTSLMSRRCQKPDNSPRLNHSSSIIRGGPTKGWNFARYDKTIAGLESIKDILWDLNQAFKTALH